jgi:hypothetical protein
MIYSAAIFFVCLLAIFVIIAIHECGHFLGGVISGIPANEMKICLYTFPQYVALKDGDNWLRPKDRERFIARSLEFLKSKNGAIVFIASGLILQTIAFVIVIVGLSFFDFSQSLLKPITAALVSFLFVYLIADLRSHRSKTPFGDFTGLWRVSHWASLIITAFVFTIHITVLFYVFNL